MPAIKLWGGFVPQLILQVQQVEEQDALGLVQLFPPYGEDAAELALCFHRGRVAGEAAVQGFQVFGHGGRPLQRHTIPVI